MSIKIESVTRIFKYNGTTLQDPKPSMTPEEVKAFYAMTFPELLTAIVDGPVTTRRGLSFEFRRAVGTKGGNLKQSSRDELALIATGKWNHTCGSTLLSVDEGTIECAEIFYQLAHATMTQRVDQRLTVPYNYLPFLP